MHKLKFFLIAFVMGAALLTSCKDDDDDGPKVARNTFVLNDKTYNLSLAFAEEVDNGNANTTGYVLSLTSQSGSEAFYFVINSGDNTIEGTYTAAAESSTDAETFVDGVAGIGCDEQGACSNIYKVTDPPVGRINISKSGNFYNIDFNITFENNVNTLGNYSGAILM